MNNDSHPVVRQASFPFPDGRFPRDLGAVVQRTVAEGRLPALVVVHDSDGDWLIGDGINDPNLPGASGLYCLSCLVEEDASLSETACLQPGSAAYRDGPGLPWTIEPFRYEDGEG
ncbi:hypothetical protein ACFVXG_26950 [Kitasatospora sp. NPDC058162]|uniref:hypothetical protein n=1 Tax=Kitasatospora sp. NPDC058162 TaxID=3346362 RepID=UPI0036DF10AF